MTLNTAVQKSTQAARPKVVVVMPARNAAATLEKTVRDIPEGSADEVILVDDGSQDETVDIARRLGLSVILHSETRGYGANQKTCYSEARKRNADIVVMIHPDYQYDSALVQLFILLIERDICDIVLGSRVRTRQECLASGMPLYKYLSNRFLTVLQNIVTGQNLSEWHTGYRAYSSAVLDTIPYHRNNNGFLFDGQFLIQAAYFRLRMGDLPVPCRYMSEASSVGFIKSVAYGLGILKTLLQYLVQKSGIASFAIFRPGGDDAQK